MKAGDRQSDCNLHNSVALTLSYRILLSLMGFNLSSYFLFFFHLFFYDILMHISLISCTYSFYHQSKFLFLIKKKRK
ncbi:hypothetical protein LguiB_018337 [Lonicera macranthoides]